MKYSTRKTVITAFAFRLDCNGSNRVSETGRLGVNLHCVLDWFIKVRKPNILTVVATGQNFCNYKCLRQFNLLIDLISKLKIIWLKIKYELARIYLVSKIK